MSLKVNKNHKAGLKMIFTRNNYNKRLGGRFSLPCHTHPSPFPSASHMANALLFFPLTTNPNRRPLVSFSKKEVPFQPMGMILQPGLDSPSRG